MTEQTHVLWREGEWHCDYHRGLAGQGRLEVYFGARLISAEATPTGTAATQRGEVLRQRVLRGDLTAPENLH